MAKDKVKKESPKDSDENVVTLDEALKLAQGHHRAQNYILAERTYRDILNAVPDHYPTTHNLGILLFQSGNFEEALVYLDKALKEDPENADCWSNYGAIHTQMGNLEEALEAYNKALKFNPDHFDALNNKTYTLWSLDRLDEAEESAKGLVKREPENVSALINLGITQARLKKHKEAIKTWEKASEINPDNASIWANWGNTLRDMGRVAASEAPCRRAVELNPKSPEALNNLANAMRDLGDLEKAAEYYRKATDIKPDFHEAHNNLAIAMLDQEKYSEAAVAARYAVAFKKDYAPAYNNLSKALLALGEFSQAHMVAQKSVHLTPDEADPYLDLADVLLRSDRFDDGDAALQEALKRNPNAPRTYMKLSEVKDVLGDTEEALAAIEKALELSPEMPVFMLRKARILTSVNDIQESLTILDKVIEKAPTMLAAYMAKAENLVSMNENEEALKVVRQVLSHDDSLAGPYFILKSLKKFKSEDDEDFIAMKRIADRVKDGSIEERVTINYALSEVYEQMGNFDMAFEHLKEASDLKRKLLPYDSSRIVATYEGVKNAYPAKTFEERKEEGCKSDVPVFIVGMPRSGTTLTEQIISSHPDVYGAGELSYIRAVRGKTHNLKDADLNALGEEYVRMAKALDKSGKATRITDKMPGNYMNMGFIALALPKAKIIHCRRNPIDTCLSCYKQNFARGQYWSYDLEEMAAEYKRYLDIMDYWREVMPDRFIEVDYEETVGNFEEQARKLIDYVGLEWDDACLEPHKQKRAVLTASKAQVTKPVYKTSVDKWKRYEEQLQPLVRELLPDQASSKK